MPSPNNVLTADSYIQDGLVFQLDGIEYGGVDGRWIDRKQLVSFNTNSSNIIRHDTNFEFKGTSYSKLVSGSASFDKITHCIDVAINDQSIEPYPRIFATSSASNIGCAKYGRRKIVFELGAAMQYQCPFDLIVAHANVLNQRVIIQGNVTRKIANDSFGLGTDTSLGGTNVGQRTLFKGSIYAIRVYSRQLTDREILINQKIDNARFGLGLNIPDEVLPATRYLSLLEPFELTDESESEPEPTNDNLDER